MVMNHNYYDYYKNSLKSKPTKTRVCAFLLQNRQTDRKLKIEWQWELGNS